MSERRGLPPDLTSLLDSAGPLCPAFFLSAPRAYGVAERLRRPAAQPLGRTLMPRVAALLALLATPAGALTLLPEHVPDLPLAALSGDMVSDGARYGIFQGAGRLIPGSAPGFVGDEVYDADGLYFGSVDEVYEGPGPSRTLVVGLARGLAADDHRVLYVRLPANVVSDGRIVLPAGRAAMARLAR